jgi:uroporphyrinogen decarboxylase
MMTPRERVLLSIDHQDVDRVPIDYNGSCAALTDNLFRHYKVSSLDELLQALHVDIRRLPPLVYQGEQRYHHGVKADYWGVTEGALNAGDSSNPSPLAEITSVDEIEAYPWPSPDDFHDVNNIASHIDRYEGYAIHAAVWAGIFHNYIWMCGFENCLVYMHTMPDVAKAILRHITDFWIGYTKKVLEIGQGRIDLVDSFNDFGTQISLIMSPAMLREFILPEIERFFRVAKNYGAKGYLHSCGCVVPVIPELVAIGVDILDPVQVSAKDMTPENLKRSFGKIVTFHGAIDTQHILPEGSVDDVRREVSRVIQILGQSGGYILAGSQAFEIDIPVANIVAMYDQAYRFGQVK